MRTPRTVALAVTLAGFLAFPAAGSAATTFKVDSTADFAAAPPDGICKAPNGRCTLREAVVEANALPGSDAITLPAGAITLNAGQLPVTQSLAITGVGAAATTIDGGNASRILFATGSATALTLSDLKLTRGNDQNGAAIDDVSSAVLTLRRVAVSDNRSGVATPGNGAVLLGPPPGSGASLLVEDSTVTGNVVGGSGIAGIAAVYVASNKAIAVTVKRSTFRTNTAGGGGGGGTGGALLLGGGAGSTVAVEDSTFSDNSSGGGTGGTGYGPAIYMSSLGSASMTVARSTFARNRAGGGGNAATGVGGALLFNGSVGRLDVVGSTFSGNAAGGGGVGAQGVAGALEFDGTGASLTVTNSTFSGNHAGGTEAGADGYGGAVALGSGTAASLVNTTIAGNGVSKPSPGHAGALQGGAAYKLRNTILAQNDSGGVANACEAAATSLGHNLETGTSCALTGTGDRNANPLLSPLAQGLGPTQTMALPRNSPAVDAGDNSGCPASDQRGIKRPQGPACDVGAFELDYVPPVLAQLKESHKTFRVKAKGPAEVQASRKKRKRAKQGTTFSYSLSEAARVVFTVERKSAGRKQGTKCKRQTRKNRKRRRCTRYTPAGSFAQPAVQGANTKKFSGKIGRRKLKPGSYRLTLVAKDPSGNVSKAARLRFKVVRR